MDSDPQSRNMLQSFNGLLREFAMSNSTFANKTLSLINDEERSAEDLANTFKQIADANKYSDDFTTAYNAGRALGELSKFYSSYNSSQTVNFGANFLLGVVNASGHFYNNVSNVVSSINMWRFDFWSFTNSLTNLEYYLFEAEISNIESLIQSASVK